MTTSMFFIFFGIYNYANLLWNSFWDKKKVKKEVSSKHNMEQSPSALKLMLTYCSQLLNHRKVLALGQVDWLGLHTEMSLTLLAPKSMNPSVLHFVGS